MSRTLVLAALVVVGSTEAGANQPPKVSLGEAWNRLVGNAHAELEACKMLGGTTFGDVVVSYSVKTRRWSTSMSQSLGKLGPTIATCAKKALARHLPLYYDYDAGSLRRKLLSSDALTTSLVIGVPDPVLPPAATLVPVWRRVLGTGKDVVVARRELAKLLPPDYKLAKDACIHTDRGAIANGQYLWLPTAGTLIPQIWREPVRKMLGFPADTMIWSGPGELIAKRDNALCLVSFDAARQATLRAAMDTVGSCWAGSFEDVLLRPRIAFPANEYTSVSTRDGRTCATTTTGKVVCCGNGSPLPAAPQPLMSIVLVDGGACGLDTRGAAVCWGSTPAPPAGFFTKLVANHVQVCGTRLTGAVECWGKNPQPLASPPGVTAVVSDGSSACGVRRDGLAACWPDNNVSSVTYPLPDAFDEVAMNRFLLCGRRSSDGSVRCMAPSASISFVPPPVGKMLALTGHHTQFCGVRADRGIECWGDPFPTKDFTDTTWPLARMVFASASPTAPFRTSFEGRVVDEHDRPIARAEVLLCTSPIGCWGTRLSSSLDTLAEYVTKRKAHWKSDRYALATTDRDGRWKASVSIDPSNNPLMVSSVFTAPRRELVEQMGSYIEPWKVGGKVVLRPAIDVDVSARCGSQPCAGALRVSSVQYRWNDGTRLARLAPGTHTISVVNQHGQPTEMRGTLAVDITYTSKSHAVTVALAPVGTGKSISGTASFDGKTAGVRVNATCGDPNDQIIREATTDDAGRFELKNVGAPPCIVAPSSGGGGVSVETLPATGVVVTGTTVRER